MVLSDLTPTKSSNEVIVLFREEKENTRWHLTNLLSVLSTHGGAEGRIDGSLSWAIARHHRHDLWPGQISVDFIYSLDSYYTGSVYTVTYNTDSYYTAVRVVGISEIMEFRLIGDGNEDPKQIQDSAILPLAKL